MEAPNAKAPPGVATGRGEDDSEALGGAHQFSSQGGTEGQAKARVAAAVYELPDGAYQVLTATTTLYRCTAAQAVNAVSDALLVSDDMGRPADLWATFDAPPLPEGLLPPIIEEFARARAEIMGADPGGLAMAALAVCAASIPDRVTVQVKRHDPGWLEPARLWVALVGEPSAKKSPVVKAAAHPLKEIDARLHREWAKKKAEWDQLSAEDRKKTPAPPMVRALMEDITAEAAEDVLKASADGILCFQDELSGWFGAMDAYKPTKGAMKDRAFWLQSFDGGVYNVSRVTRGHFQVPNLSINLLGGIQPEPVRKLAGDATDDGLLQRIMPVVLRPGRMGQDAPMPPVATRYGELVDQLFAMRDYWHRGPLRFSDEARAVREQCEVRHYDLQGAEMINRKIAAHAGKLDGMFARLCVVLHCVEHAGREVPPTIEADTAQRVADFMERFTWPHAIAFYGGTLGLTDNHDVVQDVAGYILAHGKDVVTVRDFGRATRLMRSLDRHAVHRVMEALETLAWVERITDARRSDSAQWRVNPRVHDMFASRATVEANRRQMQREWIIAQARSGDEVRDDSW